MIKVRIAGTGSFLPARTLTNDDLAQFVDTSDEWITSRTGIKERHILAPGEEPSSMGVAAARAALAAAGLGPDDFDLLVVATNVPEEPVPGTAPHITAGLATSREPAFFDLNAGCTGFVYALSLAAMAISSRAFQRALVIGTEALSRFVDWGDRHTCVLFGDGAGAVVLEPSEGEAGVLGVSLHGDATKRDLLRVEAGGVRLPASQETVRQKRHFLKMEGRGVFHSAVPMMERATREALSQAGLTPADIDWLIPHQANLRIITPLAARLGIPEERVVVNIDRVANTSTASIPIALDELVRRGEVKPGQILAFTAFGAGASYGTVILRW
jgi:3-oxoacyl-[acyl-carrier-protein] synthase-3